MRWPIRRKTVKLTSLELSYIETGQPHGLPLLLLHGDWATAEMTWKPYYDWLGQRYRVIAPDHRGHGYTADPALGDTTYATYARDTISLCYKLELNSDDLIIIGHSAGAVTSLIISSIAPSLVNFQILIGCSLEHGISDHYQRGIRDFFHTQTLLKPPTKWRYILKEPINSLALKLAHKKTHWYRLLQQSWHRWISPIPLGHTDLLEIEAKSLLISGDKDEFITPKEVQRLSTLLPNAEMLILPKEKHLFVMHKPQRLMRSIAQHLSLPSPK